MAKMQLPADFKDLLRFLNSHQADYMVIGGYAVGYYGYPRPTGDLAIWIAQTDTNVERVSAALVDFGFPPDQVPPALFMGDGRMVRMGVAPMKIEIVTKISGVSFADCYPRALACDFDDVPTKLISLRDLRHNKAASGRYRDLDDLENLPADDQGTR